MCVRERERGIFSSLVSFFTGIIIQEEKECSILGVCVCVCGEVVAIHSSFSTGFTTKGRKLMHSYIHTTSLPSTTCITQ